MWSDHDVGTCSLITGGTSGIGKATAEVLQSRGYWVASPDNVRKVSARAREELPADVLVLRADARSLADTDGGVSEVRERFGTLTTLFLNAGVSHPVALDACDEATSDDVFAVNPFGRVGRPDDIAETVAFLASDGAAYSTGQEIVVPGGAGLDV